MSKRSRHTPNPSLCQSAAGICFAAGEEGLTQQLQAGFKQLSPRGGGAPASDRSEGRGQGVKRLLGTFVNALWSHTVLLLSGLISSLFRVDTRFFLELDFYFLLSSLQWKELTSFPSEVTERWYSSILNSLHVLMAALLSVGNYWNIKSCLSFMTLHSVTVLSCSAGAGYVFMHFRHKIGQKERKKKTSFTALFPAVVSAATVHLYLFQVTKTTLRWRAQTRTRWARSY